MPAVELVLTPDTRWAVGVTELVGITAAEGFAGLGLAGARVTPDIAGIFSAAGIKCHEVMALLITGDDATTMKHAERLAHSAALVGAPWITTVFVAQLDDRRLKVIERCAAIMAEAGARMAVEFSPAGAVRSIREGLAVVDAVGSERAGLLVDSWHFHVGSSTWADLERLRPEQIASVQFSDVLAPRSANLMEETMERRGMPGDGIAELDRFAETVLSTGYAGLVSVEVLNRELRELPIREFVERAYRCSTPYWS